jgi:hypothetical protein
VSEGDGATPQLADKIMAQSPIQEVTIKVGKVRYSRKAVIANSQL